MFLKCLTYKVTIHGRIPCASKVAVVVTRAQIDAQAIREAVVDALAGAQLENTDSVDVALSSIVVEEQE